MLLYGVMTSVMPKGVEHAGYPQYKIYEQRVMTSVMPKGVEHVQEGAAFVSGTGGDDLCDAERR